MDDRVDREVGHSLLSDPCPIHPMFRWPDKLLTVILAYGLVFVGLPILCLLSYLWIKGEL